jgi:hypothetical protein
MGKFFAIAAYCYGYDFHNMGASEAFGIFPKSLTNSDYIVIASLSGNFY